LIRKAIVAALAVAVLVGIMAPRDAGAAAEQRRFSLVISAIPGSIEGGDFNKTIDFINISELESRGLEPLERISFAWQFGLEARYFVRPYLAITAGVSQLRTVTSREFLPALNESVELRGEVLSVPIHVGGALYMAPYTQGDFQARAFFGAALLSSVYNKALITQGSSGFPEGDPNDPGSFREQGTQDSPGFSAEFGVHMFFASRYSVLISGMFRSLTVRGMHNVLTGEPLTTQSGQPYELDMTGLGARFAVGIGLSQ